MITCWINKRAIARALDVNRPLPDRARRHVRECPACRQCYELELELTQRLAAGAERHYQSPSPFLHAKIMASLDRRPRMAQPDGRVLHPLWLTALVIAALGLFSIPFLRNSHKSHGETNSRSSTDPQAAIEQLASHVTALAGRNVFEWAKSLDEPLEVEMQSVVTDAKTAIQLLAQNFLPETASQSSPR